jgi:hypothetical protein
VLHSCPICSISSSMSRISSAEPSFADGPPAEVAALQDGTAVAAMSGADRMQYVLGQAIEDLPEEAGALLKSIATPKNLALMAGSTAGLVALNVALPGVGAAVTAVLAGGGVLAGGAQAIGGAKEVAQALGEAAKAQDKDALDEAARDLAHGTTQMTAGLAVGVLSSRGAKLGKLRNGGAPAAESASARAAAATTAEVSRPPPSITAPARPPTEPHVPKPGTHLLPQRVVPTEGRANVLWLDAEMRGNLQHTSFPKIRGHETLDIVGHADNVGRKLYGTDATGVERGYNSKTLAALVESRAGPLDQLPENFILRLHGCRAAESGLAQKVANRINRPVLAPEHDVDYSRTFHPRFGNETVVISPLDDAGALGGRYRLVRPEPPAE